MMQIDVMRNNMFYFLLLIKVQNVWLVLRLFITWLYVLWKSICTLLEFLFSCIFSHLLLNLFDHGMMCCLLRSFSLLHFVRQSPLKWFLDQWSGLGVDCETELSSPKKCGLSQLVPDLIIEELHFVWWSCHTSVTNMQKQRRANSFVVHAWVSSWDERQKVRKRQRDPFSQQRAQRVSS